MKKFLLALSLAVSSLFGLAGGAHAAGGGIALDRFPADKLHDMAALQNGAKLFVNYCLSCHSAAYMRYNRMRDIGLTEEQIKANLLFAGAKVGDPMTVPLDPRQAKDWFGGVPPDLSVIARSRASGAGSGADYLYTLLRTFYRDDSKATGWNNLVFPSIGMPHVLWERQGPRELVITEVRAGKDHGSWEEARTVHAADGSTAVSTKPLSGYAGHGAFAYAFTPQDAAQSVRYDDEVADLVAFLQWMGEPAQASRVRIGAWVLLFLFVFTVIAWRLNAAYWRDIK